MKVALGTIVKNESFFLKKHFPKMLPCFDGLVAIDTGSTDNTISVLKDLKGHVREYKGEMHFGNYCNAMIKFAEDLGFDALFMIAADECLFQEHIKTAIESLNHYYTATFPRIEFVEDCQHFDPTIYPDRQCRIHRLNDGVHWRNKVHEMLFDKNGRALVEREDNVFLPTCHIFHYGRTKHRDFLFQKDLIYQQLMEGKNPNVPTNIKAPEWKGFYGKKQKFIGAQPTD